MNEHERDTHFQGSAQLLWTDLDLMISELCIERADSSHPVVRKIVKRIQKRIAQHDFDLACHALKYVDDDFAWRKGKGYSVAQIVENDIPDMTGQPEKPDETGC